MLSVDDIRKLTEVFATKEDLFNLKAEFVTNDRFNESLGKLDEILGEVVATRQEFAAHHQSHEDIDLRLDTIESIPAIAHEIRKKKKP